MLKRIIWFLNIIMGSSISVFIGHGIYVYGHYKKYPDLYAAQSAPRYTGILMYGVFTLIVLAVSFILKIIMNTIIQKKMKQ